MLIDVRNAANLFRAVPEKASLVTAITLVTSALNNNTRYRAQSNSSQSNNCTLSVKSRSSYNLQHTCCHISYFIITHPHFHTSYFSYITSRCIMPPCPPETTVWESMKAKNFLLSTLNNTRGWVSVVGTKGSGKTQRVLSTCHTLLTTSRNKDFVWVDFNGIGMCPWSNYQSNPP